MEFPFAAGRCLSLSISLVVNDTDGWYAKRSNAKDPGRKRVKQMSYKGWIAGTQCRKRFPAIAADTSVPKMPPLGKIREICIPISDEPARAMEAPAVGCRCRDAVLAR
jgi:hypothetical protein